MKIVRGAALLFLVCLLGLGGCSELARRDDAVSACAQSEASYDCQVERYRSVNAD